MPESGADNQLLELVRLPSQVASGEALDEFEPWPESMQVQRVGRHAVKVWFSGELLTAMVYQADEGTLRFVSIPYDEHVYILQGSAVLVTDGGQAHEFGAGDAFVVPKGWSGTWQFLKGYRELVVFETRSVGGAMHDWFGWD
jgi:uncharacterized cupin superfamily protein